MAMLTVAGLCLLFIGWLLARPYTIQRRRDKLRRQSFPAAWRTILEQQTPFFRRLPAGLQDQLQQHMLVFIAEKQFIGCAGLSITDEMRVTIAAQACLLILNRNTDYYPKLERILVYPSAFLVDKQEVDEAGVLSPYRDVLAGESWGDGQVILSWEDAVEGAHCFGDGVNVVIHEFAHQLDQEKGAATGAPVLASANHYQTWSTVFESEFAALQHNALTNHVSLFDFYGAEHPAEFFAVASEVFFEQPQELAHRHPSLYQQLRNFYRVDPVNWHSSQVVNHSS